MSYRVITELEDEMQFPLPAKHLDEVDEVGMFEVLEHPDLPEGDLLDEGIILALHKLLDCHQVASVSGMGSCDIGENCANRDVGYKRDAGNPIFNTLSNTTSMICSTCKRPTGICLQS